MKIDACWNPVLAKRRDMHVANDRYEGIEKCVPLLSLAKELEVAVMQMA